MPLRLMGPDPPFRACVRAFCFGIAGDVDQNCFVILDDETSPPKRATPHIQCVTKCVKGVTFPL